MEKTWRYIRHNQALVTGSVIALVIAVWAYGCQSSVVSILEAPDRVTRAELQVEVDTFLAKAELRFADLDQQDKIKTTFFNTAIEFAQGGRINPIAFALVIGNLLGLSAVIDNRRKDVRIQTYKNNSQNNHVPPLIPN